MSKTKAVPGSAGLTVVGDKSLEFYKDAIGFADKRIKQTKSRIFLSRLLNKPTVFIASNRGVQQLLNVADSSGHVDLGYAALMQPVFGDNLLFENQEEAIRLRGLLQKLLQQQTSPDFQDIISRITAQELESISNEDNICPYDVCKRLSTKICLSIFLNIDFEKNHDLAEDITKLTTEHWHGIISVPFNWKVPMSSSSSGFSRAIEAKKALLKVIHEQLCQTSEGFPKLIKDAGFASEEEAANHLLLFTAALVPKALASILSSFILAVGSRPIIQNNARSSEEYLACILLEVQRLWPPFVGGRRLVRQDIEIEGYKIAAGSAMMYLTWHAHRDPLAFFEPDEFVPSRWKNCDEKMKSQLFLYGGGPRCCIGQQLVSMILKTISSGFLEKFSWQNKEGAQNENIKVLPVLRRVNEVTVELQKI